MDPRIWCVLRDSYTDFKCSVVVGGQKSPEFNAGQGVHQGDVFSMKLYQVFNNDLLNELQEAGTGAHVGEYNVSCPAFADDITIMALSESGISYLLNIAYSYSIKWRMKFNYEKSHILIFGHDKLGRTNNKTFKFGSKTIEVVTGERHLGIPLSPRGTFVDAYLKDRLGNCKRTVGAIMSIGVTPLTQAKLYKSLTLTKLTYGLEVLNISPCIMDIMDKFQRESATSFQGLPRCTSTLAAEALIGWLPVEAIIDLNRLLFLSGLLFLPFTNLCRKVLVHRWLYYMNQKKNLQEKMTSLSPVYLMYETVRKYGLLSYIQELLLFGNLSYKYTKTSFKNCINKYFYQLWKKKLFLYPKLELYREVIFEIRICCWWILCRKFPRLLPECKTVLRLITGEHALNSNPGSRLKTSNSGLCDQCEMYSLESVYHLLFECDAYLTERIIYLNALSETMPLAMRTQFNTMPGMVKVKFLLSGFGLEGFCREWLSTYIKVVEFCHHLYRIRCEKAGLITIK